MPQKVRHVQHAESLTQRMAGGKDENMNQVFWIAFGKHSGSGRLYHMAGTDNKHIRDSWNKDEMVVLIRQIIIERPKPMTDTPEPTDADMDAGELFMERIKKRGATKHDFIEALAQARREGAEIERLSAAINALKIPQDDEIRAHSKNSYKNGYTHAMRDLRAALSPQEGK